MEYVLAIIIGYLLGSINPAYLFGKMKGFDIRERGSKNAGASNAKICLGWGYFIVVVAYDVLKSIIAVLLIRLIFKDAYLASIVAGLAAIIGHCYPFYLDFNGGKGFASYIGFSFIVDWKWCLIILFISLVLALLLNYIVVSTASMIIGFPIAIFILKASIAVVIIMAIGSLVVLWKHRINAVKFLSKQEIGINGKPIGISLLKNNPVA